MDFTLEELKILAENGQKDLQYAVGFYYENGIHTLTDYAQAAQWYEKAAEKDHVDALLHLGFLYAQGKGVKKTKQEHFPTSNARLRRAVKMPSIIWPDVMRKALGPDRIIPKPLTGIRKPDMQGDYRAMCCMGGYFLSGQAVPQSTERAFQLFEKAANANIPAAQYNLSILYRYGEGVEKDEAKATCG